MAQQTYYELLKLPQWQKKRLEILEKNGFECEQCSAGDKSLQIHHTFYRKGWKPWEYPDESLHCLCEDCHKMAQDAMADLHYTIGMLPISDMERLYGYVCGLSLLNEPEESWEVLSLPFAWGIADVFSLTPNDVIDALADKRIDGHTLKVISRLRKSEQLERSRQAGLEV